MTTVVYLPGLLCDARLWHHQTETLAGVAQPWVADLTRDTTMAALAARVLDEAPSETFSLVGLSMGGYVAMEILRQAPERVARLALLDTSPRADTPEQTKIRRDMIELSSRGTFKGVTSRMLPMLIHPDRLEDDRLTATVMAMAEHVGQQAYVRQQTAIMGRVDSTASLSLVRCPTLVLGGRQDALTGPDVMAEIAAAVPGAKHVIVEDCGHLASLEQPHAVSAALSYWLQEATP